MKRSLSKLAFMAIAVLAGVVLCVQTASAQAKRKPTAKPAAKKPAEKVNNNFAILEFDEWINDNNPFEDEEYIYFLDYPSGSSNALRAVNKKTGEVKLVVPKKKRARTKIRVHIPDAVKEHIGTAVLVHLAYVLHDAAVDVLHETLAVGLVRSQGVLMLHNGCLPYC